MGDTTMVDTMVNDGLWDAFNNYHMGTTAENICDIWGITREELDEFAASSQQKTEAAQKAGRFEDEIVPVMVKKKKEMVEFKVDEFPKAGVTEESVAKLRGAFPVGPESIDEEVVHTFELTAVNGERHQEARPACHRRQRLRHQRRRCRHRAGLRRGRDQVRPEAHGQAGQLGPGRRGPEGHGRGPRARLPPGHG